MYDIQRELDLEREHLFTRSLTLDVRTEPSRISQNTGLLRPVRAFSFTPHLRGASAQLANAKARMYMSTNLSVILSVFTARAPGTLHPAEPFSMLNFHSMLNFPGRAESKPVCV